MPSRRSAIAPTVERILAAIEDAGLDSDRRADLAVATGEALSNAAVHGNRLRSGSQVLITVGVALLLSNLGYVKFSSVWKLWPLVLIGVGLNILFSQGGKGKG